LKTAISDSGAIPFPTEITSPIVPLLAILSNVGVFAASNGVFPSNLGVEDLPLHLKEHKSNVRQNYPSKLCLSKFLISFLNLTIFLRSFSIFILEFISKQKFYFF